LIRFPFILPRLCISAKKAYSDRIILAGIPSQTIPIIKSNKVIFDFRLPLISPHMSEALIECLYATPGSTLKRGDKLLDLSVDLSTNFAQDCPPISFYRVILGEKAVLRELRVARGKTCKLDEVIAVFSTEPDEPLDQPVQRGIRLSTAGIIYHSNLWTGNEH
jgi:hypothetical protein